MKNNANCKSFASRQLVLISVLAIVQTKTYYKTVHVKFYVITDQDKDELFISSLSIINTETKEIIPQWKRRNFVYKTMSLGFSLY